MNNALIATTATNEARDESLEPSKRSTRFEWRWIALVCMLLGISGGIRYWRAWQFQSLSKESEVPPFPLKEFPKDLGGGWRAVEGSETTLEPEIAQIAGASDHLIRTYVDDSGESVVVMILYGLAYRVWPHTPDVCYPANGFKSVPPSGDVEIQVPDTTTKARFRMQNFVKFKTGQGDYREVYHSFLNAGEWGLDMAKNWKSFRHHPGMFKVQVQHQGSSLSGNTESNSVKQLLGRIVVEIEWRSAAKS